MPNIDLSGAPKLESIEFIGLLGVGGMSRVYKARQTLLDRFVAVKVLSADALKTDLAFKRFEIEAKLTSQLSHPNIVKVMNYGIAEDGQAYIVMEYLEGSPLSEVISKDAPISFRRFQNFFLPLLAALQEAHNNNIIHRDIKPSNIIISKDAQGKEIAKLVDFGIAKAYLGDTESTLPSGLTKTGLTIGSPIYMSPEQCQGMELDNRSDLYSLACVMFETMNGEPPFSSDSSLDVMYKHLHEPRIKTKELSARMEIPENLAKAILFGLNKDVSKRPESAAKFAARLSAALDEVTLDRVPLKRKKAKSAKKRILGIALICGLALLLVAATCMLFAHFYKEQNNQGVVLKSKDSAEALLMEADRLTYMPGKKLEAVKLSEKAIELQKHGSPSSLAHAYLKEVFYISRVELRGRDLQIKAIEYAKRAAAIFKRLKNNNDYYQANDYVITGYCNLRQQDEALRYLSALEAEGDKFHKNWILKMKMNCFLMGSKYGEAVEFWKKQRIERNSSELSMRNVDFYKAWNSYCYALRKLSRIKEAVSEQEQVARQLTMDKNPNPPQRAELFVSMVVLQQCRPARFAELAKIEITQNQAAYKLFPCEESWIRFYIGEANEALGKPDIAAAEILKALRKTDKDKSLDYNLRDLRTQCLTHLVQLSKDDPATQKEYQDELDELRN